MNSLLTLLTERQDKPALPKTRADRFATANAMNDAYFAGWNPNPVLLKLLLNRGQ